MMRKSRLDASFQPQSLDLVGLRIKENPDSRDLWRERRMVAEKLGTDAVRNELKFAEEILSVDVRNTCAWFHRQWAFEMFGERENELVFCGKHLEEDISNEPAWHQRFFAVQKCGIGVGEINYAVKTILEYPENEYPWSYLSRLYKEIKREGGKLEDGIDRQNLIVEFDRQKLDFVFVNVLDRESVAEAKALFFMERRLCVEMNIIKNGKKYLYALGTLLDLIILGYKPIFTVKFAVEEIYPGSSFVEAIYSVLKFICPLKANDWKWRVDKIRKVVIACFVS